ncbi:hypothetical protein ACFYVR_25145 [Rhodococcus sp. NPDC003318]|uniref:hypothetical protein n=1 Tax=Rhodococcus sp. NPDC003318 TaxID=3364503 RepID=UPI00369B481B
MTASPNLFADCTLPGCPNPVAAAGQVCGACREAFGPMLQPARAEAMTAEEIAHRDGAVRDIYAARIPDHAAGAAEPVPASTPDRDGEVQA